LGGHEGWYEPARPLLFGVQALYEDQVAAAGAWAVENGARRLLVIHSDPAAFVNAAKAAEPAAKKTDPSVTAELLSVKFQSTDYSPVVSQVRAKKPDAVVLVLAAPEAAAYLKEAKQQGVSVPAYGYAPPASAATLTLAGDAAEGFNAVQLVKAPTDDDPAVKEFRDAMAKYAPDQPADFIALWGWMHAKVFAEIAKTVDGPITGESLVKAYEEADSVDVGVAPVMSFSADKHLGTRQVQRVTVKDGTWVSVGDFFTPPERD
jgi:ABC-type branched-subunit amino acid transport system substrate-binding protein